MNSQRSTEVSEVTDLCLTGLGPSTASAKPDDVKQKKAFHPCLLRLKDSGIAVDSPVTLVNAGFSSVAMSFFSIFRITPALLFVLSREFSRVSPDLSLCEDLLEVFLFTWVALLVFVLFVLGIVLTVSQKISKRWPLLLHPWGLLLMYLDVFVWIGLTIWLHTQVLQHHELRQRVFKNFNNFLGFFICMYVESIVCGALYYLYATYFIAAELSVIENFF